MDTLESPDESESLDAKDEPSSSELSESVVEVPDESVVPDVVSELLLVSPELEVEDSEESVPLDEESVSSDDESVPLYEESVSFDEESASLDVELSVPLSSDS